MEKTQRQISLETELDQENVILREMISTQAVKAQQFIDSGYSMEKQLYADLKELRKDIAKQKKTISTIEKELKSLFPKS